MKDLFEGVKIGLIFLTLEFVVGMGVAMFGQHDEANLAAEPLYSKILFGLHVFIAVGMLLGGIMSLVRANRVDNQEWRRLASAGFWAVVVAFGAGILTITLAEPADEWASLLMAVSWLVAFWCYAKLYFSLKK